ncbi:transmembrane protein, putative [Bodo saltans]|uniref:Transmembrane protein, putative n=1 Tax=Bodo saltans TaxID=75058 RepID=A0A0S4JR74_BODSA|nr:transmembrane protein, putative [Bodo saltans]|eukprot:CUG93061.1 transmembrane protein, putative [Bodo saltans]
MSATTPTYTRDDDRIVHALLSPSTVSPSSAEAAHKNYQFFVSSAIGRLKGFRSVEEREANCGPFALSVVVFGVLSIILVTVAACALPTPTLKAAAPRELAPWIDVSLGMAGAFAAYSIWTSRWSSYSLTPTRRISILVVMFVAFGVLVMKVTRLHDGVASLSSTQHLVLGLQIGIGVAAAAVLLTNRSRLSRLASTMRDNTSPLS